jgi:PKD repeat protein
VNTTATFSAVGSYVLRLTASDSTLLSSDDVTITVSSGSGGMLVGSQTTPVGPVNLTAAGPLDWAHWGLTSATSFNHKSGGNPSISNVTALGSGTVNRVNGNPIGYSWTDGTPTASATNTPSGIWTSGVGAGFELSVPAGTTQRRLAVYVGLWAAQGRLEVTLSDGSAPAFIDTSLDNSTGTSVRVYTFDYRAGSNGQLLTVQWTVQTAHNSFGNVTLQAATLEP